MYAFAFEMRSRITSAEVGCLSTVTIGGCTGVVGLACGAWADMMAASANKVIKTEVKNLLTFIGIFSPPV
jgi:hypothetical protein